MDTTQGMPPVPMPAGSMLEILRKRYNSAKYVADLWIPIMQASFFYAVPFRNRYKIAVGQATIFRAGTNSLSYISGRGFLLNHNSTKEVHFLKQNGNKLKTTFLT